MPKHSPDLDLADARRQTLARLLKKSTITKNDVATLRASEVALGLQTLAEAELVFAIERRTVEKCREWGDLLVELITDFAVWGERPTGAISEARALWLSDQVGETPTPACLALLVSILDEATELPPWFPPAVQVRASKVFGQGRAIRPLMRAA